MNSFETEKRNTMHGFSQARPRKVCCGGPQSKGCRHLPVVGENEFQSSREKGCLSPSKAGY